MRRFRRGITRFFCVLFLCAAAGSAAGAGIVLNPSYDWSVPSLGCVFEAGETRDILKLLDSGRTVRATWLLRIGNRERSFVRFARKDALDEGYIIYAEEGLLPDGPMNSRELLSRFSILESWDMSPLGPWNPGEELQVRVIYDIYRGLPPLSFGALFRTLRIWTPWGSFIRSESFVP